MLTPEQIQQTKQRFGQPSVKTERKSLNKVDFWANLETQSQKRQVVDEYKASPQGKSFFSRVIEAGKERGTAIEESFARSEKGFKGEEGGQTPVETGFQTAGELAGFGGDILFEGIKSIGNLFIKGQAAINPYETEKTLKAKLSSPFKKVAETEEGQKGLAALGKGVEMWQKYKEKNPRAAENIEATLNLGDLMLAMKIGSMGSKAIEESVEEATERFAKESAEALVQKQAKEQSQEKVLREAGEQLTKKTEKELPGTTEDILTAAKGTASKVDIKQKIAGVSSDIKKRLAGKSDKLNSYFNVSKARNLDDTLPTPLEYASNQVGKAQKQMEGLLSDTGSDIGKFRQKIKTVKVPKDKLDEVVQTFDSELDKLNLSVKNGQVYNSAGKPVKVTKSEIKTLQTLRDNLNKLKASPSVDNLIENRMIFDSTINFKKLSKEVSSIVDPLSRNVRKNIANINAEIIGKSQADLLQEYSNLITALAELKEYTGRKAGSEFLLKRVLSERGREVREVLATVNKWTDVDLMDDATMAQIATDLIGNPRQKGLFRQEIQKAGLDAASLMSKGKFGAMQMLLDYGTKKFIRPEKEFLKAAR